MEMRYLNEFSPYSSDVLTEPPPVVALPVIDSAPCSQIADELGNCLILAISRVVVAMVLQAAEARAPNGDTSTYPNLHAGTVYSSSVLIGNDNHGGQSPL